LAEESSRRVRSTGIAIIASETRAAFPGSNQSGRKSWNHAQALEIDGSGWGSAVSRARATRPTKPRTGDSIGSFGARSSTMTQQSILRPRIKNKHAKRRVGTAFLQAATAGGVVPDFPMDFHDPDEGKSTLATGTVSVLIHLAIIALLFLFASLKPEIIEEIIPVMLLK
jgi:hypothetical protein